MLNTKLEELTNKYIDGELTAPEKDELNVLLRDKDKKQYFDSVVNSLDVLKRNKPAAEQIDITNSVMNTIRKQTEPYMKKTMSSGFTQNFRGAKIGYALSFALGVLITGIIFLLQPGYSEVDEAFTKGTMSNPDLNRTYFMDESSLNGSIKVEYSGEIVILDVGLKTSEAINCKLSFSESQFAVFGVKNMEPQSKGNFTTGKNSVHLSHLESNHYLVFLRSFNRTPGKIDARFFNEDVNVTNLTIDINY